MIEIYGSFYGNWQPKMEELQEIEPEYADAGFKGCAGCLDFMKFK